MSSISRRKKDHRPVGSHTTGEYVAQKSALLPATVSLKMPGTWLVLAANPVINSHEWHSSRQGNP